MGATERQLENARAANNVLRNALREAMAERDEARTDRDILRGHLAALWVEVHCLRGEVEALEGALDAIQLNAEVIPDPRMDGLTDCYAVPLDDIDGGDDA